MVRSLNIKVNTERLVSSISELASAQAFAAHEEIYLLTVALCEESDHPVHPCSLSSFHKLSRDPRILLADSGD